MFRDRKLISFVFPLVILPAFCQVDLGEFLYSIPQLPVSTNWETSLLVSVPTLETETISIDLNYDTQTTALVFNSDSFNEVALTDIARTHMIISSPVEVSLFLRYSNATAGVQGGMTRVPQFNPDITIRTFTVEENDRFLSSFVLSNYNLDNDTFDITATFLDSSGKTIHTSSQVITVDTRLVVLTNSFFDLPQGDPDWKIRITAESEATNWDLQGLLIEQDGSNNYYIYSQPMRTPAQRLQRFSSGWNNSQFSLCGQSPILINALVQIINTGGVCSEN
ncbi:hypothetical protein SCOR_05690 [Sulfidibacter corallicola]|uniref:Uncharacterized protein n=1 Tax=Sulfidibacter corallicola TaxID=2818388 RepID=A0A8A4TYY8_SULCO|nr:hypothetical protein [Sulfidibacter corallicola]QTD51735.1 hypothetical protein J3U87_04635 [Sulfidibacter corallicola]